MVFQVRCCKLLAFLHIMIELARSDPIILGTTMRPNFHRKEGEVALPCPKSHPWAMANGTRCCERFHQANDFSKDLDWYDAESLCYGNNSIFCPNRKLCITRQEFMEPDPCPNIFPIQMKNACCKSMWKKNDSDCDGGRIVDNDDPKCCQDGGLFQTSACQANKKRCVALIGADLCPESHPWALANGTRCCKRFHRINDYSKDLDWYDPASLCYDDNSIPCKSANWCSTRPEVITPIECPYTHPVQMKNACCKSVWDKDSSFGSANLIDPEDDASRCLPEYLFQPIMCQEHKKRCVAQVPPIDCSLKNVDYFRHDLGGPFTPGPVVNSHLDCKAQCQIIPNCEVYTYAGLPSSMYYQRCFYKSSSAGGLVDNPEAIAGPKFCP
ncbi:uncharacterized protein LOC131887204 [Tigriopus californicus]|uniref:uncharacterized protein LOC131887204 n=1 Tax=Tigriopus californicus TaxID=6832 RepID=UPI0027DA141B|nr:uncharacterized protein LOC131887204 [Tigriopus californicus]